MAPYMCVLGTAPVQNGVHTVGVHGVTGWYKLTVCEGLVGNAISSLLRVSYSAVMCTVRR